MADFSKPSRKTSRKPHAKTTKDPRFNVSPWFSCSETGLPMLRIVIPISSPYPKPFKQSRYSGSFVFFNAHPLNQASLFRGFALKKPVTFVTGFVARPGLPASLHYAVIPAVRLTQSLSNNPDTRDRLSFLTLIRSIKPACFAASH